MEFIGKKKMRGKNERKTEKGMCEKKKKTTRRRRKKQKRIERKNFKREKQ